MGEEEEHVGRVWEFPAVREQYEVYKNSEVVTNLLSAGDFSVPGITTFFKLRCPCVIAASMQSCVDERISATFHYIRAIKKYIQYNKTIKEKIKDKETYSFMQNLNNQVMNLVDATLCTKVSHPALAWGIGSSKNLPILNK